MPRRLACALALVGLVACPRRIEPVPPTAGPTLVQLCLRVVDGDSSIAPQLARDPLVERMSQGMQPQVSFTPEQYAAAAFAKEADPRFSWDRLRKNARFVRPFVEHVQANQRQLVEGALTRARELVDAQLTPSEVGVNLVCGGPWDAYVLIFGRPELYFDVGFLADAPLAEALPDFEALLEHELWHFAFLSHQQRHWPVDYRKATEPSELFLYQMLNEGIGHYYSMRFKLEPSPRIEDLDRKQRQAFSLLNQRYQPWRELKDPKAREEALWHSHAGVPFWEKWSAVPAALMAHRLIQAFGARSVARRIEQEPFSFFIAYSDACADHPDWPRIPTMLVDDARRGLAAFRERAVKPR
jgi:hypothetical protein